MKKEDKSIGAEEFVSVKGELNGFEEENECVMRQS